MRSDDGVFFIPIDVFQKQVAWSIRNYNDENLKRSTHLVLNDVSNNPGNTPWCGKKCTKHEYSLKSESEQRVIVKAVTWETRAAPKKCKSQATTRSAKEGIKGHVLYITGGQFDKQGV